MQTTKRPLGLGILTLSLVALATACGGGGGGDDIGATPPTADAGAPQTLPEDGPATLAGTATPGTSPVASVLWTQIDGPTVDLMGADTSTATFITPKAPIRNTESLTFRFTVTDSGGRTDSDDVSVTVTSDDFVVFLADKETDEVYEVYLSDVEAGGVAKLSGSLVSGGDVTAFGISPNGRYVAYVADQESDQVFELYVARVDGSGVVKVSSSMVAGGDVKGAPFWAPDSSRVAYYADQDTNDVIELYASKPDGTDNVKVNGALVDGGAVQDSEDDPWAPDASRLAYLADQDTDGTIEVYTSLPDGSGNVKVSGSLVPGGSAQILAGAIWSPDASRIAYAANQDTLTATELYAAVPAGGATVKLNGPLTNGGDVLATPRPAWSPSGARIAYVADQDTDTTFELYTTLANGTGNVRAHPALPTGRQVADFAWAPDGSRIAYIADQDALFVNELYASDPDGSGNVRLNPPLVFRGAVEGFRWAPDSSRVAYNADQEVDTKIEVYTSFPNGSVNAKVSVPVPPAGSAFTAAPPAIVAPPFAAWAPDASLISWVVNPPSEPVVGFSALPDGSGSVEYTGMMAANATGLPWWPYWSPDSSRLAYVASQDSATVFELYMTTPDGTSNEQICGPLVNGGNVSSATDDYAWSP